MGCSACPTIAVARIPRPCGSAGIGNGLLLELVLLLLLWVLRPNAAYLVLRQWDRHEKKINDTSSKHRSILY